MQDKDCSFRAGAGGRPAWGLSSWCPGRPQEPRDHLLSLAFRDGLHSGWSGAQADSASSSDETSSANGDSLFSMFSGPDLVAAVKQRRYEEIFKCKGQRAQECDPQLIPLESSGTALSPVSLVWERQRASATTVLLSPLWLPCRLVAQVT